MVNCHNLHTQPTTPIYPSSSPLALFREYIHFSSVGDKVRLCGYGDTPILHIGITTEYAHIYRQFLTDYFAFPFGTLS